MPPLRHCRLAAVLLVAGLAASTARAQQLAPTAPTALPSGNTLPAPLAANPAGQSTTPRRAQVTFANGLLDVRADDSSLHQVLRSIARQTGMKITGGIADQRVFGNYGPAAPSAVLATLLDGTGVNMLLRESTSDTPLELVLTPRTGAATPPATPIADDNTPEPAPAAAPASPSPADTTSPTTSGYTPPPPAAPAAGPVSIPQPLNNVNGSSSNTSPTAANFPVTHSVPTDSLPTPSTTPSSTGIVDAPNPPPAGSTTGSSPNGVKTPEQIYQQLMQLRQQQSQQPAAQPQSAPQP